MKLSPLQVLSVSEISQIHNATLSILADCGVEIQHAEMLSFLEQRGLAVDRELRRVRFSRSCVEEALSSVPSSFEVFDREGKHVFALGGGESRIAAGHNAVFWVDSETGERRPSTVSDVEQFARLCDQLECIDMIGIPVMPQDVPDSKATLLHGVRAVMKNSRKPIFFSTDSAKVNGAVIHMAQAAFAGDFNRQAYAIGQLSPTSPLFWEHGVIQALMETVNMGVPLAILPEPIAGISAPYTLAGLITVNNAECLSGLVLTQLLKPGAKVLYANSWTTADMRTGAALVGSTETTICRIAGAQLARFYHVPSHTTAPNSDNHAHDEQNAWEKALSTFCAMGAGNDLIVNCGMFATGMTCSHEQLIMDEEISAMSRRIAQGLRVSDETIASGLVKELGPHGQFLTAEHTVRHLRSDEYVSPRISVRSPYATWKAEGSKDTYRLAQERVCECRKNPGSPLDRRREQALAEIVGAFGS